MTTPTRIARDPHRLPGALSALLFGTVARVRGNRALHPDGVVMAGTFRPGGAPPVAAARLFAAGEERPALVRFSRGGGLPLPLPDVRGCALRAPDAYGPGRHQDLLLASSLAAPLGRHLLLPGWDFGRAFYSTLLLYGVGGQRLLLGARVQGLDGCRRTQELEDAARGGRVSVRLSAASPLGSWTEVGRVVLDRVAEEEAGIRFNPWMSGGGLTPVGTAMGLRDPAYRASQARASGPPPSRSAR